MDRASRPETICLLRVEDLPEDTLERFNHLFSLREKWTEEDITPYIQWVSTILEKIQAFDENKRMIKYQLPDYLCKMKLYSFVSLALVQRLLSLYRNDAFYGCVMLHFLPVLQGPVWRETDHRSAVDQIRSVFNAKWYQGLQLQKTCGYMNKSIVHHRPYVWKYLCLCLLLHWEKKDHSQVS